MGKEVKAGSSFYFISIHIIMIILVSFAASILFLEVMADDAATVTFSLEAGAYPESELHLELSAPDGYEIYYTTDGSIPTVQSKQYTETITLTADSEFGTEENFGKICIPEICLLNVAPLMKDAAIIRAAVVAPDGTMGNVTTKTYFPGMSPWEYGDIIVISIVTDPVNLLDYNTGIYALGKYYDIWKSSDEKIDEWWAIEANYTQKGRDWERPASIEIFDFSDMLTIQQDVGIRIRGGAFRKSGQKSFNVYFRKDYGQKTLKYDLFPDDVNANSGEKIIEYKRFTLRNGGNETDCLKFKDAWQQSLLKGLDFATQQNRLAVVYLNGEYWGPYNLNDKYDDNYIKAHYDVSNCLLIKHGELEEGEEDDYHYYEELLSFASRDFSDPDVYQEFQQIMDVQSMADYFAVQIYIGNADWTGDDKRNTALWRSTEINSDNQYADGRWRFMLYDTEFASSLYGQLETSWDFDSLGRAIDTWPLFAAALQNPEFRTLFKKSMYQIASTYLSPAIVNSTLDEWTAIWKPYMEDYYTRFGDLFFSWDSNVSDTKEFYANRAEFILPLMENTLPDLPPVSDKAKTGGFKIIKSWITSDPVTVQNEEDENISGNIVP